MSRPYRPRYRFAGFPGLPVALTYTPCQGCGTTNGRDKDSLCAACLELAADGRRLRERQAQVLSTDQGLYSFSRYANSNPSYQTRGTNGPALREAFTALVWTFAVATGRSGYMAGAQRLIVREGSSSLEQIMLPIVSADALRALDAAIVAELQEAYDAGLRRGRSLLGQLAAGEITFDAFNERGLRTPV